MSQRARDGQQIPEAAQAAWMEQGKQQLVSPAVWTIVPCRSVTGSGEDEITDLCKAATLLAGIKVDKKYKS